MSESRSSMDSITIQRSLLTPASYMVSYSICYDTVSSKSPLWSLMSDLGDHF